MKKLAIIGASYLQEPLIQKAKSKGIETHVFAWKANDVGEYSADYFYPISIVEKEKILAQCREIGIDGICSIASDLAAITVNYVANQMGLTGNSPESVEASTNKHKMRRCFEMNGDPSPNSIQVSCVEDLKNVHLEFPVIVKPIDRSGSRGITKVKSEDGLGKAIEEAATQGFEKYALVEEFVTGQEYSVEYISWKGEHTFLALTKKITTGAPGFIEKGHIEPASVDEETLSIIQRIVSHALDSLGIQYGASHSEIKISDDGRIRMIEIGGRMGGDHIGARLVPLSTGYDFLDAVIDIAMGIEPSALKHGGRNAAIRFVFNTDDLKALERMKAEHPEILVEEDIKHVTDEKVTDSGSRFGYYLFASENREWVETYLPAQQEE